MHIFFTASLHGKKEYEENYKKIVSLVKKAGHKIKADHVLNEEQGLSAAVVDDEYFKNFKNIISSLKKADAVFVELSKNSTTVGYILAQAIAFGKPVVIFYAGNEEPNIFKALEMTSEKLTVVRYKDLAELDMEVPAMIDFVNETQDTRFNFFVSPPIASYLDWVSKYRRVPRSVFLRRLIDEDMAKNQEYDELVGDE
jgi:hypothetical protein